jgi:hypothetical protein
MQISQILADTHMVQEDRAAAETRHKAPEDRPETDDLRRPTTEVQPYLMFRLVSALLQDLGDRLDDEEWETLSGLRAKLKNVIDPAPPNELTVRIQLLDQVFPDYEHLYTISGPVAKWYARQKSSPAAPLIPFKRGIHPAAHD